MYVYILRSKRFPERIYVGSTQNLKARLPRHNAGDVPSTKAFRPWAIEMALWFSNKEKATQFEIYLKTHSGRAFRSKHF